MTSPTVRSGSIFTPVMCAVCVVASLASVGCQSRNAAGSAILTTPSGAAISINNEIIGLSPVLHDFDFIYSNTEQITASKPGFFDTVIAVNRNTPGVENGTINIHLHADSAWSRTVEHDATNRWITINVDPRFSADDAWRRVVDAVAGRYTGIETMDRESGYLRSSAATETFQHPQFGPYQVRTQIVTAITQSHPLIYKVKLVSETNGGTEHWMPYDRVFTDDLALIEELQSRLGYKQ